MKQLPLDLLRYDKSKTPVKRFLKFAGIVMIIYGAVTPVLLADRILGLIGLSEIGYNK